MSKILASLFVHRQACPKIYIERNKTILKRKKKIGGITVPTIQAYNMTTVIRTVKYWQKEKDR